MGKNLLRKKRRLIRQKIFFLTDENESWMKNPGIVEEIQRFFKQLKPDLIADKRPLPSLDPDKLIEERHQHFLDLGYQAGGIKKTLGLDTTAFQNWRKVNGIENKINRGQKKEESKLMKFSINTASLLLPGTFGAGGKECITISKSGLALSGPVIRRLSKPEWVQLYLNESKLALFAIPCKATDESARSRVNPKSEKKAGYRKSWPGSILEKVSKTDKIDTENHHYHVKSEGIEGYPTALGFDSMKTVKN